MIQFFVMDVDGTLTDGKIYIGNDGEIMKAFNIKDGFGIHDILIPNGITPVIITGRTSKILENRCKELGIKRLYQGISNKSEKLMEITKELNKVAYIGDDINDFSCMNLVIEAGGIVGCPKDATPQIKDVADYIAEHNGGEGAVRDFIDWLMVK